MPDIIKKIGVGAGLGIASALFIFFLTKSESLFFKDLFDGYEARSYDARFRIKTADFEEGAIDDVVIIDIDQQSINDLGNYYRWRHTYHGALIDYISQGNPAAIVFDIQFDPEIDPDLDTSFISAT
jgi:CHASE2 domain-containing sensor protein